MMKAFKAHWGAGLVVISTSVSLLLLGLTWFALGRYRPGSLAALGGLLLPPTLLLGALLFTIRGYAIEQEAILVRRLLWSTRLPRIGLQSVTHEPRSMAWSLRLFGNGGLFSYAGLFSNAYLGLYRAFVTNPRDAVVLRYARRTIVVSPSPPGEFVRELSA